MATYKNYSTPDDFNTGYANSITPEVVAKWEAVFREDSRVALEEVPCQRDLVYGPNERNRIDFFPAQSSEDNAPLLVAIHGGLWCLFDKWMMHFLAKTWTQCGFHVAAINYPLAPAYSLTEIVEDCRAAVAWLWLHADQYHIRQDAISILGHSAAGQLGALVAATNWQKRDARLGKQIIHRNVGISGFYDIEPFGRTEFQRMVRFADAEYRRWSPLNHVASSFPESLLIVGENESSLLHQMADQFENALRKESVPVEKFIARGECHFSVLHELGYPTSEVFKQVYTFLRTKPITPLN